MFQKMQQAKQLWELRNKAMAMQKALASEFVTVEKNGVKVVMSGDQKVQKVEIEGERNEKVEEAVNEAIKESQKVAAKKIQEMGGGLQGLLGGLGQ